MRQYELFELKFYTTPPNDHYVDINLNAKFTIGNKCISVKGFWKGDREYAIRFYPEEVGTYTYEISGLIEKKGTLECSAALENRKGLVRAIGQHFKYSNGDWFHPFGTTVYSLFHQDDALIDETMNSLKMHPFNKVRICLFPKSFEYTHNEPLYFPFEKTNNKWDVNKPCLSFWERIEERINQLDQLEIQCDLILFHPYDRWGFSKLNSKEVKIYLDYLVRRLSAFPNLWWSLANEYDLLHYSLKDWDEFASQIYENDPFKHLLSNHNILTHWDFSNLKVSHMSLQIRFLDNLTQKIEKYKKPLLVDECKYEGNIPSSWGNISAFEMTDRFWKVITQGGYCTHGETYLNEQEILWWSKGGKLVGDSPVRISFLKNLLVSFPGPLTSCSVNWLMEFKNRVKKDIANGDFNYEDEPLYNSLSSCTEEEFLDIVYTQDEFFANSSDNIFLKYFSRNQTCKGFFNLPVEFLYSVEIIDVWEMTTKLVKSNVNGLIEIDLPGKEGMALLARKI